MGILPSPEFRLGNYRLTLSLVGFRPDVREPIPVTADKLLKINLAMVLAIPGRRRCISGEWRGKPAAKTPQQQPGNAPGESPESRPISLLAQRIPLAKAAEGKKECSALRRMAVRKAPVQRTLPPASPMPENPDASTSAANSFLLGGGVGDVATPGEGRGGRRGMRGGGMGFGGGRRRLWRRRR